MVFEPRRDIDAVTHKVAVRFLDNISQVNADPHIDALVVTKISVALGQATVDLHGATHGLNYTAKLDNSAVAEPFDQTSVVDCIAGSINPLRNSRSRMRVPSSSASMSRP